MGNMKSRAVVIFLTIVASIPKYVIKKVLSIFNRNDADGISQASFDKKNYQIPHLTV